MRLQEQDSNAYIDEILEASRIALLPNDRETLPVTTTYAQGSIAVGRNMPKCADVYHRRVLETLFFMPQYFYTVVSIQKKIRCIIFVAIAQS